MLTKLQRWTILMIVSSALFLITIDMTVLYTALPTLTHDLSVTASEKLWIINAYSLVMAGLLPAFGTLGDHLGYKRLFVVGLVIFGIASALAAYAPAAYILIAARVLLAIGAAMMMPATLSIIRITFTDDRERSMAIGIWAAIASGGAGIGPLIGGALLEYYWWGSVFLINIPVILIALCLTLPLIPDWRGQTDKKWDWLGSMQIMVGLVTLVYAIKEVGRRNGSFEIAFIAFCIGLVAIIIFVYRQNRHTDPLIDFTLFYNPCFCLGTLTAMVSTFVLTGTELAFTQQFQLVRGLSPLEAGLFTMAFPIAAFFSGLIAGWLLRWVNTLTIQWISLFITGIGLASFLLAHNATQTVQIICLVIAGSGIGGAMTAASDAIINNAPISKAGMASSIEEVSYELGSVIGVSILGSISAFVYTSSLQLGNLEVSTVVHDSLDEALIVAEHLPPVAASILKSAAQASFNQAFLTVLAAAAGILFLSALTIKIAAGRAKNI